MNPETYRPLALGGNLHTLCGALRKRPPIPVHSETWETPDGDLIDVECLPRKQGPGILVIHGLEGSGRLPMFTERSDKPIRVAGAGSA